MVLGANDTLASETTFLTLRDMLYQVMMTFLVWLTLLVPYICAEKVPRGLYSTLSGIGNRNLSVFLLCDKVESNGRSASQPKI